MCLFSGGAPGRPRWRTAAAATLGPTVYPAPHVTRRLPTRPSQHSPGPLPPGARQEACRGGRSRSLVVLSRNSRCPLPEPGSQDRPVACTALWRRAGGRWEGKAPGHLPALGPPSSGDLNPLRPSPGAVPAQAPVSPPRLSPAALSAFHFWLGAERPYLLPRLCVDDFLRLTGAPRGPRLGQPFLPEDALRPPGSPAVPLWEAPVGRALLPAVPLDRLASGGRAGALGVVFSLLF